MPILLPTLVDQAFDYLVPEGTPEGTLVETTLAGRKLVGVVWEHSTIEGGLAPGVYPREGGDPSLKTLTPAASGSPSATQDSSDSDGGLAPKPPPAEFSPYSLRAGSPSATQGTPKPKKEFTVKPVLQVLNAIPPLSKPYRDWLNWIAEFTLAPKGAVLSLCGLTHALKIPKKPLVIKPMQIDLPQLTVAQHQVAEALCAPFSSISASVQRENVKPILLDGVTGSGKTEVYFHAIAAALEFGVRSSEFREALLSEAPAMNPSPLRGEDGWGPSGAQTLNANIAELGQLASAAKLGELSRPHPSPPPMGEGTSSARGDNGTLTNPESPILSPQSQTLILVPEIALTHQLLARFEKTFGTAPIVWHSRMTPAARARAWQAVARGEAPVVVGARSALFLPFKNLRLIVVDEEHDPSYKQEDGVLYHARDMAVVRAHFERIPIILASATPSLETLENVRAGKYQALTLPERFGVAGLPSVQLVDMKNTPPERGDFLSPRVIAAMMQTLARGEQVLLFLNRRGYAPLLLCRGCGHRFACKSCSAWLVVHGRGEGVVMPRVAEGEPLAAGVSASGAKGTRSPSKQLLHCHHCGHREPMPTECPECNAPAEKLAPCGPGVERIAEEVRALFREFRVQSSEFSETLVGEAFVSEAPAMDSSPHRGEVGWGPSGAKTLPLVNTLLHAKSLRETMTDAERKLWHLLRREALGVKFRKQHPIGHYIADFACLEPKLIVELDGGQHAEASAQAKDAARTAFLESQGFTVLRFWNHEMLQQSDAVLQVIVAKLGELLRPHPNPPPMGEGTASAQPHSGGVINWCASTISKEEPVNGAPAMDSSPHRGEVGWGPSGEKTLPSRNSELCTLNSPSIVTLSSDESIAADTWAAIEAGTVDIIIGTQMVAKGHHFPKLTLVVVVDADVGLSGADLRAGERSYQLLHQLGGRAGRGELPGTVLVQTYLPEHPVMQSLAAHDRDRLMLLEARERKAGGWPPYGQLAAIVLDGVDEAKVRAAGQALARSAPADARLKVLGPAIAPMSKLRGQYRYRLLVKAEKGINLQRTLRGWIGGQKFSGVRMKVDVNPYYFM